MTGCGPHRRCARAHLWAALLAIAGLLLPSAALAEESNADPPPRWHIFFGADAAEESMFGHAGFVWAPAGDLHHTGWRLRAVAGGGTFDYLAGTRDITGKLLSAAVLPGFQWIGTSSGITIYGGPVVQDQSTDPDDPGKPRQGTRLGAKVLVEGWIRISEGVCLNGSASYAAAAETYSARVAASVALDERFALEPEFAAFGEPGYDQQRYGLLVEFRRSPRLSLKLGGGWAVEPDGDGPYAAFQVKAWR